MTVLTKGTKIKNTRLRGFEPSDLSNLTLWFDAFDKSTVTIDATNNISQWDDKSGNNNHFTQGSFLNQPFYRKNFLNGKPVVNFRDGSDILNTPLTSIPQPWTVFFLVNGPDWGSRSMLFDNTTYSIRYAQHNNTKKLGFTHYGFVHYVFNTPPIFTPFNTWKTLIYMGESSKLWAFLDAQSSSLNLNFPMPTLRIRTFLGNLAEIIVYNKALNSTERDLIKNYLSRKWGV